MMLILMSLSTSITHTHTHTHIHTYTARHQILNKGYSKVLITTLIHFQTGLGVLNELKKQIKTVKDTCDGDIR